MINFGTASIFVLNIRGYCLYLFICLSRSHCCRRRCFLFAMVLFENYLFMFGLVSFQDVFCRQRLQTYNLYQFNINKHTTNKFILPSSSSLPPHQHHITTPHRKKNSYVYEWNIQKRKKNWKLWTKATP